MAKITVHGGATDKTAPPVVVPAPKAEAPAEVLPVVVVAVPVPTRPQGRVVRTLQNREKAGS